MTKKENFKRRKTKATKHSPGFAISRKNLYENVI